MSRKKKEWQAPKLICLYRGRLEEAVLAGCKAPSVPATPGTSVCVSTTTRCKNIDPLS